MCLQPGTRAVLVISIAISALGVGGCSKECDGYFYCFEPCEQGAFNADGFEDARATCRANVQNGACGAGADPNQCTCDCEN